jgi:NadR type nicotinamide-nucleotide adenylyltransferase
MNADLPKQVITPHRIAIVGPECTGKTALAQVIAEHYQTEWVREYARGYLDKLAIPYVQEDLLRIAKGQMLIEDEFFRDANKLLICDTNLLVLKVWSEFKYQRCDPWILEEIANRNYALHLLTYIDVPWQADPQREHPHEREKLYAIYKQELVQMNVPFIELRGTIEKRKEIAIHALDNLLNNE